MPTIWILVLLSPIGGEIEVAAYDTPQDCDEVAYYMNMHLEGASAKCFIDEGWER